MTNHIHLIVSSQTNELSAIVRDFKKYTSKQIIAAIIANEKESRKTWMLNMFRYARAGNVGNTEYQFWQNDYHPIALDTTEKTTQRFAYLHQNPIMPGIVSDAPSYTHSSASNYYLQEEGLIAIDYL